MRVIALIPARYSANRFPAKLMKLLNGKTVIRHVYENAVSSQLFEEVVVVTDSELIYNEITLYGGKCIMSLKEFESGCDRIVEPLQKMEADIIVNIQGDVPFVNENSLRKLLEAFKEEDLQVASLMQVFEEKEFIGNNNFVKVVVDNKSNALFFSRSPIPFNRSCDSRLVYYEHIGIYAFRREALLTFSKLQQGVYEATEKIEVLRFLENGIRVKMVVGNFKNIQIDVPQDLERAEAYIKSLIN